MAVLKIVIVTDVNILQINSLVLNFIFYILLQVLVMTPQILLDTLRHSFLKLSMIKVLIVDECHHARGNHPYACIMRVSCLFFFFVCN